MATYENYGALTYWGVDLEARAQVSPSATLSVAGSWISEDHFDVTGASCL